VIADALSKISEWAIPGFGCTDCSCNTHLFAFEKLPFEKFHQLSIFQNGLILRDSSSSGAVRNGER
jgi:sugar fermentation stimulation protein A